MSQDYDKIFKENIEEIILPLAKKVLNIDSEGLEEIPDDLQPTLKGKPDFLKKVVHTNSKKDYILYIKFLPIFGVPPTIIFHKNCQITVFLSKNYKY